MALDHINKRAILFPIRYNGLLIPYMYNGLLNH